MLPVLVLARLQFHRNVYGQVGELTVLIALQGAHALGDATLCHLHRDRIFIGQAVKVKEMEEDSFLRSQISDSHRRREGPSL